MLKMNVGVCLIVGNSTKYGNEWKTLSTYLISVGSLSCDCLLLMTSKHKAELAFNLINSKVSHQVRAFQMAQW